MKTDDSKPVLRRKRRFLSSAWLIGLCAALFSGGAALQAQQADLWVDSFSQFAPNILSPGGHPTGLQFSIYNGGSDEVDGDVNVEVFMSRNNTFNDGDDISLGQMSLSVVLLLGSTTNVVLDAFYPADAAILSNFTVPSDACGWYTNMYLQAAAQGYADPNPNNNVHGLGFISHVLNQTGPAPTVQSIDRLFPTDATTGASAVTWRVTFLDTVIGVGSEDFVLTFMSGSISGAQIVSVLQQSSSVYDVTVNTGTGSGVLRLDVPSNALIYSLCEVRITQGFTTGETYTLQRIGPVTILVPSLTNGPVPSVDVVFSGQINLVTFTY